MLLAVPGGPAGRLLAELAGTAPELAGVPYASVAVVTLVVRGLGERGSGILVPPAELPTIKALTYSGDQVGLGGRGGGRGLGRGRRGGPGQPRPRRGRRGAAARRPGAAGAHVRRGPDHPGLGPRRAGHRRGDPVGWRRCPSTGWATATWSTRLRADLAGVPGLAVAGAALDGVGIAACLGSAYAAVAKITADLGGGGGRIDP